MENPHKVSNSEKVSEYGPEQPQLSFSVIGKLPQPEQQPVRSTFITVVSGG